MDKRQPNVPMSDLRMRLNERMWEQQKKQKEHNIQDKTPNTLTPESSSSSPFFFVLITLGFLRSMHRQFHLKMAIALLVVLFIGVSQLWGWAWANNLLSGVKHIVYWDMDMRYIREQVVPAVADMDINELQRNLRFSGGKMEIAPVAGEVKSGYGMRDNPVSGEVEMHYGVDIIASRGEKIRSILPGKVQQVRENEEVKQVTLEHGNGWSSVYGGMKEVKVQREEWVDEKQVLGILADREVWSNPHLYFELRWEGRPQDPTKFWDFNVDQQH